MEVYIDNTVYISKQYAVRKGTIHIHYQYYVYVIQKIQPK